MSWLAQNWIWVAIAIGVAWFFLRGRAHGHAGGAGGLLDALGGHGSRGSHAAHPQAAAPAHPPDSAIDAVSGEAVRTAQALSLVYQEKIYYFASKENRERFEAAPQEYAHKTAGHAVQAAEPARETAHRRHGGCC